jgi:hypothetical protein
MKRPIALQVKHIVELHPPAPFNFDATLYNPSHFPSADNEWQPGVRWQTMLWQKQRNYFPRRERRSLSSVEEILPQFLIRD